MTKIRHHEQLYQQLNANRGKDAKQPTEFYWYRKR